VRSGSEKASRGARCMSALTFIAITRGESLRSLVKRFAGPRIFANRIVLTSDAKSIRDRRRDGSSARVNPKSRRHLCYLIALFLGATLQPLHAGPDMGAYVDSYVARLSVRDHFNSNGQRLLSAAAIIRQDRANFYVYGIRDPEDQSDSFFSNKTNRASLERLLENGATTPQAIERVVNGTPLIRTEIYERGITVTILSD
jgi:hypothetical protein